MSIRSISESYRGRQKQVINDEDVDQLIQFDIVQQNYVAESFQNNIEQPQNIVSINPPSEKSIKMTNLINQQSSSEIQSNDQQVNDAANILINQAPPDQFVRQELFVRHEHLIRQLEVQQQEIRQVIDQFQQTHINKKLKVFEGLLQTTSVQIFVNLVKLILSVLAYQKNQSCTQKDIISYIGVGIIQAGVVLLIQTYLSYYITVDYLHLKNRRENAQLSYQDQEFANPSTLFEGFQERNPSFRYFRYFSQIYYVVMFFYGNVVVLSNLNVSACQLGDTSTNFIWAVVFFIFIMSYFSVGVPLLLLILYLLIAPFVLLFAQPNQGRVIPIQKTTFSKLTVLKFSASEIKEEFFCVICLVNYKAGDEYIVLPCNVLHIYHKQCIQEWLNVNDLCPLCKKRVNQPEENNN